MTRRIWWHVCARWWECLADRALARGDFHRASLRYGRAEKFFHKLGPGR